MIAIYLILSFIFAVAFCFLSFLAPGLAPKYNSLDEETRGHVKVVMLLWLLSGFGLSTNLYFLIGAI